MNMSRLPDDEEIEREWQAQEYALAQERRDADPSTDVAGVQRYRLLARALREPPRDGLPNDFARRVARAAAAANSVNIGFERRLMQCMIGVFALAAIGVTVSYGADWLPALTEGARIGRFLDQRWLLALLACIGVSIAAQRAGLRRSP